MASLLPSFMEDEINSMLQSEEASTASTNTLTIPEEYGIDFKTGQMTGKIVQGLEAIKVWIWQCLHTERFRYPLYSWQYGTRLEQYIGHVLSDEYLQADCEDEITEALTVNPYITGLEDFTAEKEDDHMTISFRCITTLGDIEVNENV